LAGWNHLGVVGRTVGLGLHYVGETSLFKAGKGTNKNHFNGQISQGRINHCAGLPVGPWEGPRRHYRLKSSSTFWGKKSAPQTEIILATRITFTY